MWRNLARMAVIVLGGSVLTGCYSFFPAKPSVTIEQARSIVAKDGYQLLNIGLTIDRPVDAKTFYGICKDGTGKEYAYWIDTKTMTLRTVQLGVSGYLTYEKISDSLLKQGQSASNVKKDLILELSATNTFYWQYNVTGQKWNQKGNLITTSPS